MRSCMAGVLDRIDARGLRRRPDLGGATPAARGADG